MNIKSPLKLICYFFIGGILISVNSVGGDDKQLANKGTPTNIHPPVNYYQRQIEIRSHIFGMFPGTYLDSMSIVINLLSDSIRHELAITKVNDSIIYLKKCLENASKDSILLARLGGISVEEEHPMSLINGTLIAHCKDISNSFVVDSVTMDIFSGSHLIASSVSDSFGIIQMHNIPKGNYDIVFSRKAYAPLSFKHFVVSDDGQLYLYVPLKRKSNVIVQMMGDNVFASLIGGGIILLLIVAVLAYYLAKFMVKKAKKTT